MAYFFPPFHLVPSPSRSLIHKTKVKSVVVMMMTMTMEPKEGMMIIMKRNELWQNGFYVDGDDGSAADYDNRDLTKLRRRRQRERQKNNRFNEQNNNFARASRFFVHFFVIPAQVRREMANFTFT